MSARRSMKKLLSVLTMQEEQAQTALKHSLAQLRRLENALQAAMERERFGRRLVAVSAHSGEAIDRVAALEECAAGQRAAEVLRPRVVTAGGEAAERREELMRRRIERRQAEVMIRESEARAVLEAGRRSQQVLDDWYLGSSRSKASVPAHDFDDHGDIEVNLE